MGFVSTDYHDAHWSLLGQRKVALEYKTKKSKVGITGGHISAGYERQILSSLNSTSHFKHPQALDEVLKAKRDHMKVNAWR